MNALWIVMRQEFVLLGRGRGIWAVGFIMALIGLWEATAARSQPSGAWSQLILAMFFITLILAFTTGDQINRDYEQHLDGVIFTTPVSTIVYVLGKYLAALFTLLSLSAVGLLAAIITDALYPQIDQAFLLQAIRFPSLGPWPYLVSWCYLMIIPVLFASALVLAGITLTRGQRIIPYLAVLLIWMVTFLADVTGLKIPEFFDVLTMRFVILYSFSNRITIQLLQLEKRSLAGSPRLPDPTLAKSTVHLLQTYMPPPYLPLAFLWNRLFFLGVTMLIIGVTVYGVSRQRKGVM